MKITNISCTQFAGTRDRNISLADGINVIYGKNESGKSTLVNLLSRTLFQNAKINGRTDKEFCNLYFPGSKKGSNIQGDFADGKITFETKNGTYTLSKEWGSGSDSRCMLSTPDGDIRDQEKINEILREELFYGEGVYSDMLFSSQRNTDTSLQTILDVSKKTDAKEEITDVISQAFAESDGISLDSIEQKIAENIKAIEGKHWNFENEAPERKSGGGQWVKDVGEVLAAYYKLEDAKNIIEEISELEESADHAAEEYNKKDNEFNEAKEAYEAFNDYAGSLQLIKEKKDSVKRIGDDIEKRREVLEKWPDFINKYKKAETLKNEKISRELLDKYDSAKEIYNDLNKLKSNIPEHQPDETEIKQVKNAQKKIFSLENKLCGMNIVAGINMLGGNNIEILSVRTGEAIEISEDNAHITEAVKITIPGVMEMQLAPADIDVDATRKQIATQEQIVNEVLSKYEVEDLDELEELVKSAVDKKNEIANRERDLNYLLGDKEYEDLEAEAKKTAADIRPKEAIENDINELCGKNDIKDFSTEKKTLIESYEKDYISIDNLKTEIGKLEEELKNAKDAVSKTENIPEEYLGISDPEEHLKNLKKDWDDKYEVRDGALRAKEGTASKLEERRNKLSVDPEENYKKAELAFNEQKELLEHWKHIEEVFRNLKEEIDNNPMQDVAESFTRYLNVISDGKVSSEFPKADKLDMNIYSDDKLLDYGKLSEGTKETVSLAFRLAVLDHLFPDGGGVIVFDDSFANMDAERVTQSCSLIKECAKKHQVIFLTCREEYLGMLNGNEIRF